MNLLKIMIASAVMATTPIAAETIGRQEQKLSSDRMTPEVLWSMGRIGTHHASPDGKKVVYQVTYYSVALNKSRTVIVLSDIDGTNRVELTQGDKSELEPTFIQGGQRIAYLSGGQLWSMALDGSDRLQMSEGDELGGYLFSPDESQVILIREVPQTTSIQPKEEDLPLASGMVIDDMNYKHWDQYVTSIPHIFLASFDGKKVSSQAKDLLEGEPFECPMLPFGGTEQFCFSPDGKQIAYTCRKKTGVAYAISTDSDIYLYNIADGTTRNLCKPADYQEPECDATQTLAIQAKNKSQEDINAGYDQNPQFSPNGQYVAWQSMEHDGYESDRTRLCVYDLKTGRKQYVTESLDAAVDAFTWAPDSKVLYFLSVLRARSMVFAANLKGEVRMLTTGDYDYGALQVMPDGKRLLVERHSISTPADLYLLTPIKKKPAVLNQITKENDHILAQLALGEVKERIVKTTDNKDMLCWVIYPSHFDPKKKYPTLLFCEGGPQSPVSQFWSYRWNFQIMAAHDYIIIAPNRRGLPGFGSEWNEAISGDYSGQCMRDYLSAIDDIAKEPYVDAQHLGCVGASFGGYSVYWLAGNHDKRFKAFIAHDGIYNTQQQYVETEEMWFANWDLLAAPWRRGFTASGNPTVTTAASPTLKPADAFASSDGKRNVFAESPHLFVDRWDTPILCIHGDKDYRILSSQGQSAFNAARLRGIPAQLLLYPDENHWVLKPQNGILWQRTYFRWLDKWLKQ
ncbi:MAG: S9 family peptidase [Bacteroidales bacterium]|nr:S9 family peptidase [Candidatus Physcousia equi]